MPQESDSARPPLPPPSSSPAEPPPIPGGGAYDVVFSVAGADRELAWSIYHALRDEGVPEERIYYYKEDPGVRFNDLIFRDWEQRCGPDTFPIVVYSDAYEQSDFCKAELRHILKGLPDLPIRPFAFVSLTENLPRDYPQLDPDEYCYINAQAGDPREQIATIVDQVLFRLAETKPRLVSRCRRRHLLRTWNRPAHRRLAPPYCPGVGNADYDADPDLHEANLALAAAIGFTEKLARAMRVIYRLSQLATACEASARSRRSPSLGDVGRRVRELFDLFRARPGHYPYSEDTQAGGAADGWDGQRRRLGKYLLHHTRGSWDPGAVWEFLDTLSALGRPAAGCPGPGRGTELHYVHYQAVDCIEVLTRRLPDVVDDLGGLDGDDLARAAYEYSNALAVWLRKGVSYCGT